MLRQVDRRAGAAFPPEAPVAFPDVAGGGDMGVLGQIDGRATVALAAIAPVAFPADAEHGAMGVLRPVGSVAGRKTGSSRQDQGAAKPQPPQGALAHRPASPSAQDTKWTSCPRSSHARLKQRGPTPAKAYTN